MKIFLSFYTLNVFCPEKFRQLLYNASDPRWGLCTFLDGFDSHLHLVTIPKITFPTNDDEDTFFLNLPIYFSNLDSSSAICHSDFDRTDKKYPRTILNRIRWGVKVNAKNVHITLRKGAKYKLILMWFSNTH